MKALRAVIAAALITVPAAALAQDVKTDYDKSYNFTGPKTYAIRIATAWGNNLGERRVLTEFDEELSGKGWKKVPEAQAELVVLLHGATDTKRSATTFYSGMGGGYGPYGYGGWGMGMGTSQTMVNEYTVGTLVLDMFDSKTKNLVFRGTAEDELSDNAEKNAKKLEKASTKMFKNFPPKPAS
jgi:hypothetical protein